MSVRPILHADNPILRQKARRVKEFNTALRQLVDDMFETLAAANGVGLAAPQVGLSQRLFVIALPPDEQAHKPGRRYVLCNPEIVKAQGQETDEEGCLSLPGYVGEVTRAAVVTVKALDAQGRPVRVKGEGLLARALQHELDHLDGILFTDRLESLDKLRRLIPEEGEQVVG